MLVPDAANRFGCRYHARDYGLLAANPFGSRALGVGDKHTTTIARGEPLRLRFAVVLHSGAKTNAADDADDWTGERAVLYDAVVKILAELPRPNK